MPADDTFEQLHRLIKQGDPTAIRKFFEAGVSANRRNRFGWTPLMLAASEGHSLLVSFLLATGADVHAVNNVGASALAYAALQGEFRTIQTLLDAGAALDVRPHGISLLEFAGCGNERLKTRRHLELLRAAGAE